MTHTDCQHVDVLILGAGLSGIGAACHLRDRLPGTTFRILESRDTLGGTWDLFRYPGIRSDSDMYTLGFKFRPWRGDRAITDGASILDYLRDTVTDYQLHERISHGHKAVRAEWDTPSAQWTVTVQLAETSTTTRFTANFLMACTGYYRYDEGYVLFALAGKPSDSHRHPLPVCARLAGEESGPVPAVYSVGAGGLVSAQGPDHRSLRRRTRRRPERGSRGPGRPCRTPGHTGIATAVTTPPFSFDPSPQPFSDFDSRFRVFMGSRCGS
ncbi:NAD(P)-binding protein [Nocardia brasiliensis]|uniref:Monooxygenase n=1 Tax=Nocardia brasiliensis (strain ATCC 700358 / HUJEG-1) TaxID=1133849 RepID=K0EZD1_NOCB7|nr:NAD(P)/FAD-dependent oxidoreductase [Nocardia brasiliensis]AFU05298.1 monooxygenase [Nocardia brasiliensis ATCC 700358]OCF87986.1 hypothetical protein AW168_23390 [Nocardia brasiliensis]